MKVSSDTWTIDSKIKPGRDSMLSISNYLLAIIGLIIAGLILNAYFIFRELDHIRGDAETINKAGIIRGSIQRTVKLELGGAHADSTIADIDGVFVWFESEYNDIGQIFNGGIEKLRNKWTQLKDALFAYRKSPGDSEKDIVLGLSEECWSIANQAVFSAQFAAEAKLKSFRFTFAFIGANIAALMLIMWMVRRFVRNRLEFIAHHDQLTGLFNRYTYSVVVGKELERARRYEYSLSFILFDIDYFKRVNDTFGHKTGDAVLRRLAEVVSTTIRASDYLFRLGGEEFGIIAVQTTGLDSIRFGENVRKTVESASFDQVDGITVSVGIAEYQEGDTELSLYRRADTALYRAKNGGRNRVESEGIYERR